MKVTVKAWIARAHRMPIGPRGLVHTDTMALDSHTLTFTRWVREINGKQFEFTITRWVECGHVHVSVVHDSLWRPWYPADDPCSDSPAHR